MDINTNWDGIPHTNPEVEGVFELANTTQPFGVFNGALRAEVKCTWYDRKPPTSWMHIQLLDNWELIPNYCGEVADNIAQEKV